MELPLKQDNSAVALAASWDAEYARGRYQAESPVDFVAHINAMLRAYPAQRVGRGLYVGCGNGRNYLPLLESGLHLHGLDISGKAIATLKLRKPEISSWLHEGEFLDFASVVPFDYLLALQVFQHGGQAEVNRYFKKVSEILVPEGLFALRVNSIETEIFHRHTVLETNHWGGFTIRYDDGPKAGLHVHFFSQTELEELTQADFRTVLALRQQRTQRMPPKPVLGCNGKRFGRNPLNKSLPTQATKAA